MQYEKLRYQPNKKSQLLAIIGMALMTFALFKVINVYRYVNTTTTGIITPTIWVGIEILVGIGVMLLSFLASEKLKSYDRNWAFVGIFLTVYPLAKIFMLPLSLNKTMRQMIASGDVIKYNPTVWLVTVITVLVLSAVCYAFATVIAFKKTNQLEQYYKELNSSDGN